ncbi:hypothetical protein BH10ACI3_BH10ACI3_15030 [soil metagenome]
MRIFGSLVIIALLCTAVPAQKDIVPIVDLRISGLIGGVKDGKWIEPGLAAESIMNGATDLNVFGFGGKEKRMIYAARRQPVEDVCQDFFRIKTGIKERLGVAIGSNASWKAMPRIPKGLSIQSAAYKQAVISFLKKQGVARPVAKITQAFSVDLDNDGTDEVLISATNFRHQSGFDWKAGEYSFVLLRKVTKGGVKDYLVDGNIFKKGEDNGGAPNRYEISGIADLNGDGRMEVVIYGEYYEGSGTAAFEMLGGKLELIKELQAGCGV